MISEEEEARWTRALAENGVQVLDVHGCHPNGASLASEIEEERELALAFFVHRLRLTRRMGGDAMVYHVDNKCETNARRIPNLLEALRRVEDEARELGVTVALENHYRLEGDRRTLSAAFEAFDPDFVGFTFDPGHALLSGNTDWLLEHCVSRLMILHLNDNDGEKDRHWCPLDPAGKADWPGIMKTISASPYTKPLQLEVRWSPEHHGRHAAFLREACDSAKQLSGFMA